MFDPSRDQARALFFETWRKYRAGLPLAGIESLVLDIVLLHPEYHALLADRDKSFGKDFFPEAGETNPFLHMSLHLALEEQLSIDQPPGIVQRFNALLARSGERHAALHEAIECLAGMVWRSQRDRAPPDAAAYLACLEKRAQR
ncbi:MAG: DUF1841 family protein [Betaproteobacteria bacterium]|nr:DUF1841 family protein [Betaproteobacteria bacterium]